ncbi:hypothetical protein CRG98_027548, partial [Punica granatum]
MAGMEKPHEFCISSKYRSTQLDHPLSLFMFGSIAPHQVSRRSLLHALDAPATPRSLTRALSAAAAAVPCFLPHSLPHSIDASFPRSLSACCCRSHSCSVSLPHGLDASFPHSLSACCCRSRSLLPVPPSRPRRLFPSLPLDLPLPQTE